MAMGSTHGTMTLSQKQCDDLNDLIELDFDAVEAYQAAIERLDDAECRSRLTEFKGDHERHIKDLSALVTAAGYKPATKGDAMRFLTKGKVVIANVAGDKGVLTAMRSNEETTNQKYDEALGNDRFAASPEIRQVLTRNREDERRHTAWIESRIERMD